MDSPEEAAFVVASPNTSAAFFFNASWTTGSLVLVDEDWLYAALADFTSLPSMITEPLSIRF